MGASNPFNNNTGMGFGYGDLGGQKKAAPASDGAWGNGNEAPVEEEVALDEEMGATSSHAVPTVGSTDLPKDVKKLQKELAKKEKALAKKEEELARMERELAGAAGTVAAQTKNWPRFWPLIHHDIANDIPDDFKRAVQVGWINFWAFTIVSLYNWIGSLVALITIGTKDGRLPGFFLALIYFLAGPPLVYVLMYKPLYRSAMTDRAIGFAWFFLTFMGYMVFLVWSLVGPDILVSQWSHTGIMVTINAFDKNTACGIVYLVGAVLWGLTVLLALVWVKMVYSRFRGRGKDTGTLKQEMVMHMVSTAAK